MILAFAPSLRTAAAAATFLVLASAGADASDPRFDGFNIVVSRGAPFGSDKARRSLAEAKKSGAVAIAIVPFLWQAAPSDPVIVRGSDMSDDELRLAIRDVRALGFKTIVKPHVWVDGSWAGAVAPQGEENWRTWFIRYREEIGRIGAIAAAEGADMLAIGTELTKTTARPEWRDVIATARAAFPRTLVYLAHDADEAEVVPFWDRLDLVGATLYPPLGADGDGTFRRAAMTASAQRLDRLAARTGKRVLVGEIGIRSARGAAAKPWESAEERFADPDQQVQADVLRDWLAVLQRQSIAGILVWRWFTDPAAGGAHDTDFTVQHKTAETVLRCAWTKTCAR